LIAMVIRAFKQDAFGKFVSQFQVNTYRRNGVGKYFFISSN